MNIDRAVMLMAGTLILVSVVLTAVVSTWWLILTAFVGANLLQASLTGFCPAAVILRRFGLTSGCAFR
ncbi:YgaP family membrane protein [Aeromicrobium duanguangcaii]|uniref:DUF2892 domain-containing protein n=1 Tax=Aeromicrobium duanguangcaii TaxID=2968086 RepID=A0ABY5KED4_9ACTN|nr:DUF2892 domain-containing protein [Aeromicrobium duanguangcaii]MCD9154239.1 DUF2892 domain-containing protein [Aeromicrobium duanguangcaii]UUI68690.1 DUF2892 domain-containing protein [Aeromicrobium duanguangcaii]